MTVKIHCRMIGAFEPRCQQSARYPQDIMDEEAFETAPADRKCKRCLTIIQAGTAIKVEKLLDRYWRVSSHNRYANVKRSSDGWVVDIRNNQGDFLQWGGVWGRKMDAIDTAQRILERMA